MGRSLWALAGLCPGPAARLRLLAVYAALFVRGALRRSAAGSPRRVRLRLGGIERDWWVGDAGELSALWEAFVARQYEDHLPATAELVVDVGANTGAATAWLRSRYPAARIVAVEPDPGAAERLRRNIGADRGVEIVEAAITDHRGVAHLARHGSSVMGRLVPSGGPETLAVPATTLEALLDRAAPGRRVDVLKLDVEGGEWRILEQPLGQIGTAVIEIHEPTTDGRAPDEVLADVARREGCEVLAGRWPTMRWLVRPGGGPRPL